MHAGGRTGRNKNTFSAQEFDGLWQRMDWICLYAIRDDGLMRIFRRQDHGILLPTRECDGQDPVHGLHSTIQRQLANHHPVTQCVRWDNVFGSKDTQSDCEVQP
jgi:hypothetical protein